MKLRTTIVDHTDFVGKKPLTYEHYDRPVSERMVDIEHDAVAAHAMKTAQAEARTLLTRSMQWTHAVDWINNRADQIMEQLGYGEKN